MGHALLSLLVMVSRVELEVENGVDSVEHLPVCYRYFDCFDSFSGWYGMVVFTSGIDSLIVFADLIV